MVIAQLDPAVTHANSSHRRRALALCLAGRRRSALALPRMPPPPFPAGVRGRRRRSRRRGSRRRREGGEPVHGRQPGAPHRPRNRPAVSETAAGGVSIHSSVRPVSVRYHLD